METIPSVATALTSGRGSSTVSNMGGNYGKHVRRGGGLVEKQRRWQNAVVVGFGQSGTWLTPGRILRVFSAAWVGADTATAHLGQLWVGLELRLGMSREWTDFAASSAMFGMKRRRPRLGPPDFVPIPLAVGGGDAGRGGGGLPRRQSLDFGGVFIAGLDFRWCGRSASVPN